MFWRCRSVTLPIQQAGPTYLFEDVEEIAQQQIALGLIKTDDALGEGPVHPEGLPSGSWMDSNERMHSLDVLWSGVWIVSIKIRVR